MTSEVHPHKFDPSAQTCLYCHRTMQDIENGLSIKLGQLATYQHGSGPSALTISGTIGDVNWLVEFINKERRLVREVD